MLIAMPSPISNQDVPSQDDVPDVHLENPLGRSWGDGLFPSCSINSKQSSREDVHLAICSL
jgi:hypothetical protein